MGKTAPTNTLYQKIYFCSDCNKADTWCDYHKSMARKIDRLESRIYELKKRQEDTDAIDEVREQLKELLESAK